MADTEVRLRIHPPKPGAVDDAITDMEKALARLKSTYTSQREHKWEKLARQFRGRIQNQRTELRRMNAKVHSLRGDVHLAHEEVAEAVKENLRLNLGLVSTRSRLREGDIQGALDTLAAAIGDDEDLTPASRDSQETTS